MTTSTAGVPRGTARRDEQGAAAGTVANEQQRTAWPCPRAPNMALHQDTQQMESLVRQHVNALDRNGFTTIRRAVDPALVDTMRAAFEQYLAVVKERERSLTEQWAVPASCEPGDKVTVTLAGAPAVQGRADATGAWSVSLPPQCPAGCVGKQVTIDSSDGGSQVLTDVGFGDVLFCSGQSHMTFSVNQDMNANATIAAASSFPGIRMLTVDTNTATTPLEDIARAKGATSASSWLTSTPESFGSVPLCSDELKAAINAIELSPMPKLTNDMDYLRRATGTKLPPLPVHGKDEFQLFPQLVLAQQASPPHFEQVALDWVEHVNGVTTFPKLPVYLRSYYTTFQRNARVRNAVQAAASGSEALRALNTATLVAAGVQTAPVGTNALPAGAGAEAAAAAEGGFERPIESMFLRRPGKRRRIGGRRVYRFPLRNKNKQTVY